VEGTGNLQAKEEVCEREMSEREESREATVM
jgi:hypothetical protein